MKYLLLTAIRMLLWRERAIIYRIEYLERELDRETTGLMKVQTLRYRAERLLQNLPETVHDRPAS